MAVATITLESSNGDTVVVSAPNDEYLLDDIILDTNPQGMYDTGFTVRTQSGAFETGGRVVGETVPIREPVLPFWLTKATRPRFQKLWGTPGNFQKVKCTWDGPSGPRFLTLRLAKEIAYTTEDGFDVKDDDDEFHAVVSALALNPMYEANEDVSQYVNPDDRFYLDVVGSGGTFPLSFGGQTTVVFSLAVVASGGTFPLTFGGQTTPTPLPYNASTTAVQSALQALSSVGAGKVTVIGTPGNYFVAFSIPGTLTGSATSLTGTHSLTITAGIPWNASTAIVKSALESLTSVGVGKVAVTGTPATSSVPSDYLIIFAPGTNGVLTSSTASLVGTGFGLLNKSITIDYAENVGWFDVWNPTDQPLWLEWTFDPAQRWQFPDFGFGQERKWGRAVGQDANRLIVTPQLTQMLSVMSDPFLDTYVNGDLSNAAGLFNGVEPLYQVPPYTATSDDPVVMPVVVNGPAGARVTLRQRRFWSAESGLE